MKDAEYYKRRFPQYETIEIGPIKRQWPVLVMKPLGHVWCWDEKSLQMEVESADIEAKRVLFSLIGFVVICLACLVAMLLA